MTGLVEWVCGGGVDRGHLKAWDRGFPVESGNRRATEPSHLAQNVAGRVPGVMLFDTDEKRPHHGQRHPYTLRSRRFVKECCAEGAWGTKPRKSLLLWHASLNIFRRNTRFVAAIRMI